MTKYIQQFALILFMCLTTNAAYAIDSQELPDVKEGIVTIKTIDPAKLVGYTVGDVIEREVILTIKAPYKLIDTSLPIPGYEKRYRGQLIGIELKSISHEKDESKDESTHRIKLAYQVFTNNVVAKNAALGPEYLNLINTKDPKDLVKYRIPLLSIAISPIAIFGAVKVENNMSSFLGPLLMPKQNEQQALKVSVIALALSLIGLLYIMGKNAWLPRMGGAFAKAHRQVRKTANTANGLQQAVSMTHQAINSNAGMSIFNDNLTAFLHAHPKFVPVRNELETFFGLSRQVYFEPSFQLQDTFGAAQNPHQWLVKFTRRCRDCERGLIPEPIKAPNSMNTGV
jgi:mxaA protein